MKVIKKIAWCKREVWHPKKGKKTTRIWQMQGGTIWTEHKRGTTFQAVTTSQKKRPGTCCKWNTNKCKRKMELMAYRCFRTRGKKWWMDQIRRSGRPESVRAALQRFDGHDWQTEPDVRWEGKLWTESSECRWRKVEPEKQASRMQIKTLQINEIKFEKFL